jgi:hypothetical protein
MHARVALLLPLLACATAGPGAPTVSPAAAPATIPFIEDDCARAVSEARTRHLPLFVEAWVPY